MKISQSFMKDMRSYLRGNECGLVIKKKWIDGKLLGEPSASMKLGQYFEYILTGALPKGGVKPEAEFLKASIKRNGGTAVGLGVDDMLDPYRKAHENAEHTKRVWHEAGLQIYNPLNTGDMVGVYLQKVDPNTGVIFDGTIDVIMEAVKDVKFDSGYVIEKGQKVVVDLKYSGLLDDKWSVHGWQWTDAQKEYHGTQGKQYKYIADDLEPMFNIVDPGGKYIKLFHTIIDRKAIDKHKMEGITLRKRLIELNELGMLEATPEYNKCRECPLRGSCSEAHTFPHAVDINLMEE